MASLRHILRQRLAAGIFAALLAYLLALQGLASGLSQAAMAAAALGPSPVICSPANMGVADLPDDDGNRQGSVPDCPCALFCRLTATATPTILAPQASIAPLPATTSPVLHAAVEPVDPPSSRRIIAEPRGPPSPV